MINLDNRLLEKLTGEEIGLFVHILKRIGTKKTAWPSRKLLQNETGYSRGKLARCIQGLKDKNIISFKQLNKGGTFGNIVYTIETKLAGVYISAQGYEMEENMRSTKIGTTENRTTEIGIQSINQLEVLNKKRSIKKIKLHSPGSANPEQKPLKRTIPKTTKIEEPKQLTTKQKNNLRSKDFIPQATKIKQILQEKKNIEITPAQLTAWSNSIRLLCDKNKISVERMDKVLTWYEKHWDDAYVPVIESGESFRTKFVKLEDAIERDKRPKQKIGSFRTGVNIDLKVVKRTFNAKTGQYGT